MFWSAASLLLATSGTQAGPTPDRNDPVFRKVAPALVAIGASGSAALIDASGFFVAHQASVPTESLVGRFSDGRTIQLKVKSRDQVTGMVLLEAPNFAQGPQVQPIPISFSALPDGTPLTLVVANGAFRGNFVRERLGRDRQSNRLFILSEVRFEAPDTATAGALLFTPKGELVGAMGAVLAKPTAPQPPGSNQRSSPTGPGGLGQPLSNSLPRNNSQNQGTSQFGTNAIGGIQSNMGPGQMTVAFGTGVDAFRRVALGFLSKERRADYALLGITCRDAAADGALVVTVSAGTPAARLGLRPGDELIGLGTQIIRNVGDFAKAMYQHGPDEKVSIRYRRAGQIILAEATLAKAPSPE